MLCLLFRRLFRLLLGIFVLGIENSIQLLEIKIHHVSQRTEVDCHNEIQWQRSLYFFSPILLCRLEERGDETGEKPENDDPVLVLVVAVEVVETDEGESKGEASYEEEERWWGRYGGAERLSVLGVLELLVEGAEPVLYRGFWCAWMRALWVVIIDEEGSQDADGLEWQRGA